MATESPATVVRRASHIPDARYSMSAPRPADMVRKTSTIPKTVPKSPKSGATRAIVDSISRPRSQRKSSRLLSCSRRTFIASASAAQWSMAALKRRCNEESRDLASSLALALSPSYMACAIFLSTSSGSAQAFLKKTRRSIIIAPARMERPNIAHINGPPNCMTESICKAYASFL